MAAIAARGGREQDRLRVGKLGHGGLPAEDDTSARPEHCRRVAPTRQSPVDRVDRGGGRFLAAAIYVNSNARFERQVEWKVSERESWIWTVSRGGRLCAGMDDDTAELIRALLTRAGMIMEDASLDAIMLTGSHADLSSQIVSVRRANDVVGALVRAAAALRGSVETSND